MVKNDKRRLIFRLFNYRDIRAVEVFQRPLLHDCLRAAAIDDGPLNHQHHAVGIAGCEIKIVQDAAHVELPLAHQAEKMLLVVNIECGSGLIQKQPFGRRDRLPELHQQARQQNGGKANVQPDIAVLFVKQRAEADI